MVKITIEFCRVRAAEIALVIAELKLEKARIYGVPRGGIPVAYMVDEAMRTIGIASEVVYEPSIADVVVDDIIDSGITRKRFVEKPFYALIDKRISEDKTWYIFPWENDPVVDNEASATDIPIRFLQYIGEDISRPGIVDSPARVVRSWGRLYGGYKVDVKSLFKIFDEPCDEMVIVRNIEFYSMCEHHFLPFFGKAHIAYIPDGKVVGVSKLVRVVDAFARRLQIQERLTQQIVNAVVENLTPKGCACFVEAQHLCMMARGVEKQNSVMITSSLYGSFKDNNSSRLEFLLLNGRGGIHG